MSTVTLSEVKDLLNVTHNHDDKKLQMLLNAAEDRALEFMNRTQFGDLCEDDSNFVGSDETIPDAVVIAVCFLVQGMYDATPEQMPMLESAAERLMISYRCGMGM